MPQEVEWREQGGEGKLDLVVTLDFRMSSTCLYSDVVLPTATGTKRRHEHLRHAPVHPSAVGGGRSGRDSKSDWEIYKGIAKAFSEVCVGHLGQKPTW